MPVMSVSLLEPLLSPDRDEEGAPTTLLPCAYVGRVAHCESLSSRLGHCVHTRLP